MTGEWIARVARRLIRDRTYQLTVSPAIADLQHEPAASARHRFLGYAAVWRALAGAIRIDLAHDVAIAFGRDAQASAWRTAGHVYGTMFLFTLLFQRRVTFGIDELGLDGYAMVFAWRLPAVAAACLPVVLVPVALVLTRRLGSALRPILLSAAIVALVAITAGFTLVVPATRMADQYVQAAFWRARMETADPPRSLEAIRRDLTVPLTRQDQRRARADTDRFVWHDIVSRGVTTFALALIGIAFARKRGMGLFGWAVASYVAWAVVMAIAIGAYTRVFAFPQTMPGMLLWTRAIAVFAVGTLALILTRTDRRAT
jgi:hypothetical protein